MWRDATLEDDGTVIALAAALYEEDPASKPVPEAHHRQTLEVLRREPLRGRAVVLELDHTLRGYALLSACWSNELGGEVLVVDELYVSHGHRSRGHARTLIESLVLGDGPWPRVPVAIELEVTPDNTRARALYERLEFTVKRNTVLRRRL
jgi:ribosomal protein S18 acetylase RimI-like enzyme